MKRSSVVEVSSDSKGLKYKRPLKSYTDMNDGVFGEKLHSDIYKFIMSLSL
jgi:hypothetical protein